MVVSYDLWPGNGAGLFSKEKIKVTKKRISGEAYDVNKQTIHTYIVPKSTNESKVQYPRHGVRTGQKQQTCTNKERDTSIQKKHAN